MLNIFRYIPHPTYGRYGGRNQKCVSNHCTPIDWMDKAFQEHDIALRKGYKNADFRLGIKLRKGYPKELKGKPKWYARMYLASSKIVFRPKKKD